MSFQHNCHYTVYLLLFITMIFISGSAVFLKQARRKHVVGLHRVNITILINSSKLQFGNLLKSIIIICVVCLSLKIVCLMLRLLLRAGQYRFFLLFQRSTFVVSAWSFGFFILATTANDLRLRSMFYPSLYPLHFCPYLNSSEKASIFLVKVECQTRELLVPFL